MVRKLLAGEQDIELHCCLKALDAMAQANQIHPTVILQDLVLPDIDGMTLVRMFRENPATSGVAIIVLSGNDDAETRARALAGGADDYLVKLPSKHGSCGMHSAPCSSRGGSATSAEPASVTAAGSQPDARSQRHRRVQDGRQSGLHARPDRSIHQRSGIASRTAERRTAAPGCDVGAGHRAQPQGQLDDHGGAQARAVVQRAGRDRRVPPKSVQSARPGV